MDLHIDQQFKVMFHNRAASSIGTLNDFNPLSAVLPYAVRHILIDPMQCPTQAVDAAAAMAWHTTWHIVAMLGYPWANNTQLFDNVTQL